MSIRQNLRILNKPISELAMLPQETIMTMAQSGQIPVAFVAPILAEKAEASQRAVEVEADDGARTNASWLSNRKNYCSERS
jgi:hypothetical protein